MNRAIGTSGGGGWAKYARLAGGALALFTLTACGANASSDEDAVQAQQAHLWRLPSVQAWPNGNVNVCFMPAVTTTMRTRVQRLVLGSWGKIARINFWGWSTCPTSPLPANFMTIVDVNSAILDLAVTYPALDPATFPAQVTFHDDGVTDKTIVHEFGHVLGFNEENIADDNTSSPCDQRTWPGDSLENEADLTRSVMTQSRCGGGSTLSNWDILGARRVYGQKPPGSITGGAGLSAAIAGASTANGAAILGWEMNFGEWHGAFRRDSDSSLRLRAQTGASNRCLAIQGGTVSVNFTPLVAWDCVAGSNMMFEFTAMQWLAMGGMCVQASSSGAGATLSIQNCSGSALQNWDFFEGSRRIRLNATNLCVNVPGGSTTLGTQLTLATCADTANQTFTFSDSDIRFGSGDRCFNVLGGVTTPGSGLALWDGCDGVPPGPNAQFTIRGPVHSMGQCLTMNGNVPLLGVALGVYPCVGDVTQSWEYFW